MIKWTRTSRLSIKKSLSDGWVPRFCSCTRAVSLGTVSLVPLAFGVWPARPLSVQAGSQGQTRSLAPGRRERGRERSGANESAFHVRPPSTLLFCFGSARTYRETFRTNTGHCGAPHSGLQRELRPESGRFVSTSRSFSKSLCSSLCALIASSKWNSLWPKLVSFKGCNAVLSTMCNKPRPGNAVLCPLRNTVKPDTFVRLR